MVTSFGGDVTRNGARSASAVARSSTLGPTDGSAHEWSRHPCRTRFVTVVMLTPTCEGWPGQPLDEQAVPPSANLTAPIHINHPSEGTSYTTRSGVEGSRSGSMKYVPGSSGAKGLSSQMFWIDGVELNVGAELGVDIGVGATVRGGAPAAQPATMIPSPSWQSAPRLRDRLTALSPRSRS